MQKFSGSVLIVDDTRLNIEILQGLLRNDYLVHTASNGFDALQIVKVEKIDLILLDINMPGMDGFEVCARLKSDPATENIPIIFVTARDDVAEETKGLALGAIDYIIKPFSAPIVKARVRNHLRLKQYQDQLALSEAKLRELSCTDELTGLSNRRGFTLLAEQQIRLSLRLQQRFALFFADMDSLKKLNDTLGHAVGDQALLDMANLLKESFHTSDIVARIGGDEFVCLSVNTGPDEIASLGRLQKNLQMAKQTSPRPYTLSFSIGAAEFDPAAPRDLNALLAEADRQMYASKEKKRGETA